MQARFAAHSHDEADINCCTGKRCVQGLLDKEPRARLTAAEALEHCWFTGHSHNDAATLKHVHVRVAALASASSMPVRSSFCLLVGLSFGG